jgi:hypothetical protein
LSARSGWLWKESAREAPGRRATATGAGGTGVAGVCRSWGDGSDAEVRKGKEARTWKEGPAPLDKSLGFIS